MQKSQQMKTGPETLLRRNQEAEVAMETQMLAPSLWLRQEDSSCCKLPMSHIFVFQPWLFPQSDLG